MGSVFSRALSCLVEHPAPIRSHRYSPGDNCESVKAGKEGRKGAVGFPTVNGKHSSLERPSQHSQGPASSMTLPTCDLWVCEVPKVASGAPSRPDCVTFAEPRGSFAMGVSVPGGDRNVRNCDFKKFHKTKIEFEVG